MKRVTQKLNSNDGVSILIALVGFMIAAMVSIVIVTAAVSAARRVADDKTENQAHLTLESAAQIVREGIEGTEYVFSDYEDDGTIDKDTASAEGMFAAEMKSAIEDADSSKTFTISLDSYDDVSKVNGSFVMDNTDGLYDVRFTLKIDGEAEEIYVSADGYCTTQKAADGKYHITWTVVSINGLGAA